MKVQFHGVPAGQVRISIEPRWARFYDFGAGRLPAFLIELAARA